MDAVGNIIKQLKKEEIRNFKIFTNRYAREDDLKIAQLFDKLRTGRFEDDDIELISSLFPEDGGNANAYYRLKNRLKTELEKSLLNLHHNLDDRITVMNLLTLSSIFSYKAQYDLSVFYLKKGEKVALQNQYYDLLEVIYNEFITISHNYQLVNPGVYIDKRQENSVKMNVLLQANDAIATISYRLRQTNFERHNGDVQVTLVKVIDELQIANEIYKIPNVKFKIHFCIRDLLLSNKEFQKLEEYLIASYHQFEEEGLYTKTTHKSRITLLVWIVNTLMVNKKWEESSSYTDLLYEEINKHNRLHYNNFVWTYQQSQLTNYMFTSKLGEALALLDAISEEPSGKGTAFHDFALHINRALCYYYQEDTSGAVKALGHLLTKEVYPKLSAELQFSVSLLESILHYERGNLDYAGHRLNEVKRQFKTLLKREDYSEEGQFIKITLLLINKPDPLRDRQVQAAVGRFVSNATSFQIGSNKHIDYGVWLQSKMDKRGYYPALLETVNSTSVLENV